LRHPLLRLPQQVPVSNAENQSLIADPLALLEAINNAHQAPAALPDNSQARVPVPSTPHVPGLQDLVEQALPVDVLDLAHAPASALHVRADLVVHDPVPAALRLPVRRLAHNEHRRTALAAADNSTPRRRKAQ
jgi:hypothetical protein